MGCASNAFGVLGCAAPSYNHVHGLARKIILSEEDADVQECRACEEDCCADAPGRKAAPDVRRSKSGRFTVNGVDELKLVNQHPKVPVQPAPYKPRHLTPAQISAMVKLMKVA